MAIILPKSRQGQYYSYPYHASHFIHKLEFLKSDKVGKLADCSFSDAILGYSWMNDAHWGVFAKPTHPPEHGARQSFII